jgi:cell division protein ZapA
MADKPTLVHVEIFGQTYAIRAGAEPGYVEQLAAYVDGQMKEIGRSGGAVDSLRVAVLAALNVADELFQERSRTRSGDASAQARAGALADELEQVLRS